MQMILPSFLVPNAFLIRFAREKKKKITPRNDPSGLFIRGRAAEEVKEVREWKTVKKCDVSRVMWKRRSV